MAVNFKRRPSGMTQSGKGLSAPLTNRSLLATREARSLFPWENLRVLFRTSQRELFTETTRETTDALTSPRATLILPVPTTGNNANRGRNSWKDRRLERSLTALPDLAIQTDRNSLVIMTVTALSAQLISFPARSVDETTNNSSKTFAVDQHPTP
ncbi:hypothetical protein AVEN_409-1 [Araneus ventricosus]|uniref:Uncharacterized protein n=1 Tax=Araneus ventricosus TaxID=182803 RepID=A0A4Y2RCC2_ARAVE|nr:hypothetical protein AVEN_409-1 [Araneus ventricosus]